MRNEKQNFFLRISNKKRKKEGILDFKIWKMLTKTSKSSIY